MGGNIRDARLCIHVVLLGVLGRIFQLLPKSGIGYR